MSEEAEEKFLEGVGVAAVFTYPENFEITCNNCGSRDTGLGMREGQESPNEKTAVVFCYECHAIEEIY